MNPLRRIPPIRLRENIIDFQIKRTVSFAFTAFDTVRFFCVKFGFVGEGISPLRWRPAPLPAERDLLKKVDQNFKKGK